MNFDEHGPWVAFEDYESLRARVGELEKAYPKCVECGKPATCLGSYDGPFGFACDDCCGHGNEDGECCFINEIPEFVAGQRRTVRYIDDKVSKFMDEAAALRRERDALREDRKAAVDFLVFEGPCANVDDGSEGDYCDFEWCCYCKFARYMDGTSTHDTPTPSPTDDEWMRAQGWERSLMWCGIWYWVPNGTLMVDGGPALDEALVPIARKLGAEWMPEDNLWHVDELTDVGVTCDCIETPKLTALCEQERDTKEKTNDGQKSAT